MGEDESQALSEEGPALHQLAHLVVEVEDIVSLK